MCSLGYYQFFLKKIKRGMVDGYWWHLFWFRHSLLLLAFAMHLKYWLIVQWLVQIFRQKNKGMALGRAINLKAVSNHLRANQKCYEAQILVKSKLGEYTNNWSKFEK